MRKLTLVVVVMGLMVILSTPLTSHVWGEDSKEVLTLKRDLAQERVARLQAQLSLMQQQFKEGQEYLQVVTKELSDLNATLKAMEVKKEEPKPKVDVKEKK